MVSKRYSQSRNTTHHQQQQQQQQQEKSMNPYQAFLQQTSPLSEQKHVDADADDVAVGLAMDTRSYQELLKAAAADAAPIAVTVRGTKPAAADAEPIAVTVRGTKASSPLLAYDDYQRTSTNNQQQQQQPTANTVRFPILLGMHSNNNNNNNNDEAESNTNAPTLDVTVRGLPVDSRNYAAFNNNSHNNPHQQRRFPLATFTDSDNNASDEATDAVYGLPISTNNYEAIVGVGARVKVKRTPSSQQLPTRPRGVSSSSDQPRGPERRASAPLAQPSPRSPAQFVTAPATTTTTSHIPRGSCFDVPTRRSSTVAIVPFSDWLYIQRGAFRQWTKQLAVLSGTEFKYSKGVGQAPKGYGTIQRVDRWSGKPHGLELELVGSTKLYVYCIDASALEQWTNAFACALDASSASSQSNNTSYTITASKQQREGVLYKQDARATSWRRHWFVCRIDGYFECKVDVDASRADARSSGYIQSVTFAPDVHLNGLAVELDTGATVLLYAETYDDRMLWYAVLSSAALSRTNATPWPRTAAVKTSYVQTARANHAGWLRLQRGGLLKQWKRLYVTLHGNEISYSKDSTAPVVCCDVVHAVDDWSGKQNGIAIHLKSGRVWNVCADSYESAKRWRTLLAAATARHAHNNSDAFNVKRYITSRRRKGLALVYGGWFTSMQDSGVRVRQFYVLDASVLGDASEVDHQLRRIGRVVDVRASRDLECGVIVTLVNGTQLKLGADSVDSFKAWLEVLKASV